MPVKDAEQERLYPRWPKRCPLIAACRLPFSIETHMAETPFPSNRRLKLASSQQVTIEHDQVARLSRQPLALEGQPRKLSKAILEVANELATMCCPSLGGFISRRLTK